MNRHEHKPSVEVRRIGKRAAEYARCACGALIVRFSPEGRWVVSTNREHPYRAQRL